MPFVITPDLLLIAFTIGILLIYLEFNRPGLVLPGALGLLIVLIAVSDVHATLVSCVPLAFGIAIFILGLRRSLPNPAFLVATLTLVITFSQIHQIHRVTSIACGIILGTATTVLTRIARRARLSKGLD